MLPVIMLILELLRRRLVLRIDQFTAGGHFCHLFQHHCMMHCFICILSPSKRTVIFTQDCRNCLIIEPFLFKFICDQDAGILLIGVRNLCL